jgi:tetratricopeptide (TPR) repeat protein
MSKSNSQIITQTITQAIALTAVLVLVACQGGAPKPAPQPQQPVVEAAPQSSDETTSTTEAAQAPEPVDFNQQLYDRALEELKKGDTEEALTLLTRVSRDAPDKPRLFTNLGLAHFRLQQSERAEQAFVEAVARNPDDAVAHNHLGILQRRKGQFQEALGHYQRAIEIDDDYARAHLNLGILFDLYLQDLEKALQQYQQYRSLASEENALVDGWIVDIERRLKSADKQS